LFVPVAAETTGAINKDGMDFASDLGRRVTQSTDDHRESAFLFQRLSVSIRRYSAVAVLGTFTHTTPEEEMTEKNKDTANLNTYTRLLIDTRSHRLSTNAVLYTHLYSC